MTKPMLCKRGSEKDLDKPGYSCEEKYDGTCIIIESKESVQLFSRSGIEYSEHYPEILELFKNKPGIWHGELVFCNKETGLVEFLTIAATPEVKAQFDCKVIIHDNLEWSEDVYIVRRGRLEEWHLNHNLETTIVELSRRVENNHQAFFDEIKSRKGEGVVLKHKDSMYVRDGRNKDWLKIKNKDTDDVTVIGWNKGINRRADTFGALQIIGEDGRTANIGGGYNDKMLAEITRDRLLPDGKVKKRFVIEIDFMNKTKNSYRMPNFMRIRDDKKPIKGD